MNDVDPTVVDLIWVIGYGMFFIASTWDLVVIDYVLIVRFRPSFVKLPDTDYYNTAKPHVQGFLRGLVIGIIFSLISAAISLVITST